MKKFISVILTLTCVMGLMAAFATSASAYCSNCSSIGRCGFSNARLQTTSTAWQDLNFVRSTNACECRKTTGSKIDVYHNVVNGSNAYTNEFHALRRQVQSAWTTGTLTQKKWVTTGGAYPIDGVTANYNYFYNVKARGNTNHSMYDGMNSIEVSGWYAVNVR